jgi:hypothetical protein
MGHLFKWCINMYVMYDLSLLLFGTSFNIIRRYVAESDNSFDSEYAAM